MSGLPRRSPDGARSDPSTWPALRLLAVLIDIAATAKAAEGSAACPPSPVADTPSDGTALDQDQPR